MEEVEAFVNDVLNPREVAPLPAHYLTMLVSFSNVLAGHRAVRHLRRRHAGGGAAADGLDKVRHQVPQLQAGPRRGRPQGHDREGLRPPERDRGRPPRAAVRRAPLPGPGKSHAKAQVP